MLIELFQFKGSWYLKIGFKYSDPEQAMLPFLTSLKQF